MYKFSLFCLLLIAAAKTNAQQSIPPTVDSFAINDVTINYQLIIDQKKKKGKAETYNGAIKTFYSTNKHARLRFVSLMRTQNIYITVPQVNEKKIATLTKESGPTKSKMILDKNQWDLYNADYQNTVVTTEDDTLIILDKLCKKAIIHTKDGEKIVVWYIPNSDNKMMALIEPMFANVPGVVLQYEYHLKKKSITFTATLISFLPIPSNEFTIPAKGYVTTKFQTGAAPKKISEADDDE